MGAHSPSLRKIATSAIEVILGLVCLYLFWGSKHFVLTNPQDSSYQEAPAVVTKKYAKKSGGKHGWMKPYIAFEVYDAGSRAS